MRGAERHQPFFLLGLRVYVSLVLTSEPLAQVGTNNLAPFNCQRRLPVQIHQRWLRWGKAGKLWECWETCLVALCLVSMMPIGIPAAFGCSYSLTVSANPTAVCYNGSTSTITATVTVGGSPASGHTIQFSVSGPASPGSVSPTSASTNASGNATTTYTSGSNGGTVTVTAKDTTQSGQPTATCTVKVIKVLTQTVSTSPANRDRTTLGIGELVNCWTEGGIEVNWEASGGGSVTPAYNDSTTYTAPKSPATPTVHAKLDTADCTVNFTVIAPDGQTSEWDSDHPLGDSGGEYIGAASWFKVTVLPTTVSFHYASFREYIPAQGWTWPSGATENYSAQAGAPYSVNLANLWDSDHCAEGVGFGNYIGLLYDGQAYVYHTHTLNMTHEYKNDANEWVSWYPIQGHFSEYRESDQAGRLKRIAGNTAEGSWQGPYESP